METSAMTANWFYLDAVNQPNGPVTIETILALRQSYDFHVWCEGLPGWVLARSLPAECGQVSDLPKPSIDGGKKRKTNKPPKDFISLCQTIVADSFVTKAEAQLLQRWISENRDKCDQWPANVLCDRLGHILADGVIDPEEQIELVALLSQMTEQPTSAASACAMNPDIFDAPPPIVGFEEKRFCFVGKFVLGTLSQCKETVQLRGGFCSASPDADVDYVIVGSFGCKPEKISELSILRKQRKHPFIISEAHWFDALEKEGDRLLALYQDEDLAGGVQTIDASSFVLPVHEGWFGEKEEVESFSGAGSYIVNLKNHSCTCPDWVETRQWFLTGDVRRACKHICKVILDRGIQLPQLMKFVLQHRVAHERGMPNGPWLSWCQIDQHFIFVGASNTDWVNVIAPALSGKGVGVHGEFGFSPTENRWSYGTRPFKSRRLEKFILHKLGEGSVA